MRSTTLVPALREQLKIEICNYFLGAGVSRQNLSKACGEIARIGELMAWSHVEMGAPLWDSELLSEEISSHFAERHHPFVKNFILVVAGLELDKHYYLESQRPWKMMPILGRDDFEREDFDLTPSGEIEVGHDYIYVQVFGWQEGFKEQLPRGGTYLDSGRWQYPLGKLSQLKTLGLPVIYQLGVAPTDGDRTLRIYRGLPGSGKTTTAIREFGRLGVPDYFIAEMDKYPGRYLKTQRGLTLNPAIPHHEVAQWCEGTIKRWMQQGIPSIGCANTFVKVEYLVPFLSLATTHHYKVIVTDCKGRFKSLHNPPDEVIEKMQNNWEDWRQ